MYEDVLLLKSGFVFWTTLILCPKGSYLASSQNQKLSLKHSQEELHSLKQSSSSEHVEAVKALKHDIVTSEPGFDLTEYEIEKFKIWPAGIIPYYIDLYSFSDKVLRDRIRSFLNMVNSATSINFLELPSPPKDEDSRWVFFINRRGLLNCADHSAKKFTPRGVQQVVLGYECMSTGNELAEAVLAIVGIPAQHTSPDRDQYIKVLEKNIMPDKKYLFEKLNNHEWLFHDIKYDFASAGHYPSHKHSSTGRATIEIKEDYLDIPVGETNGFSDKDILKIKMLYNFISNKKQNITDCHKLFLPGADFNSYRPDGVTVKPRTKPNEYLGLPRDQSNENSDGKHLAEGSTEEINADKTDAFNAEELDDGNQKLSLISKNIRDTNVNVFQQQLENDTLSKDPLSLLSDYQTEGK